MGMAASQARALNLTARMSNIEYQGQQINQERTVLSQQATALYNTLLDLQVPTPPSTTDFAKITYAGVDGATTFTLGNIKPQGSKYLVEVNTSYSGGVVDKDAGVKKVDGSQEDKKYNVLKGSRLAAGRSGKLKAELSKIYIKTNGYCRQLTSEDYGRLYTYYVDEDNNTCIKLNDKAQKTTDSDTYYVKDDGTLTTNPDAGDGGRYPKAPAGKPIYVKGYDGEDNPILTLESGTQEKKTTEANQYYYLYPEAGDPPTSKHYYYNQYGTVKAFDAAPEEEGWYEVPTDVPVYDWGESGGLKIYSDVTTTPNSCPVNEGQELFTRTAASTGHEFTVTFPADTEGSDTYKEIRQNMSGVKFTQEMKPYKAYDPYYGDGSTNNEFYFNDALGEEEWTVDPLCKDGYTGYTVGGFYVYSFAEAEKYFSEENGYDFDWDRYREAITSTYGTSPNAYSYTDFCVYFDTSSGSVVPKFVLTKDLQTIASGADNQYTETYSYLPNGTVEKTEEKEQCILIFDAKGRITKIGMPQYGTKIDESGKKVDDTSNIIGYNYIDLKAEESYDKNAYEDAYNQYEYEQYLYDKKQQEINARTEVIHIEDRKLELKLQRLDNERTAIKTELEAVNKCINDNIDKSFKTFSA